MPEKGYRTSNKNQNKLLDEVEGIGPEKTRKKYGEGEGLTPGSPIVTDDKKKTKIPSYRNGGTVRKTGLAMVHKGERVIPAKKEKETATARFIRLRNAKQAKRKM